MKRDHGGPIALAGLGGGVAGEAAKESKANKAAGRRSRQKVEGLALTELVNFPARRVFSGDASLLPLPCRLLRQCRQRVRRASATAQELEPRWRQGVANTPRKAS